MEQFRAYIQAAFKRSGLREREVSRRMGISPSYLNGLMSGERRWNEDTTEKFCKALGINLNDLFCSDPAVQSERSEYHGLLDTIIGSGDLVIMESVFLGLEGAYTRITGEPPDITGTGRKKRSKKAQA